MPTATMTSKGQITIPKDIRDALGVETGDRLQFILRSDGVVELIPRTRDLLSLAGMLQSPRRGISIEDMDDAMGAFLAADK